MKIGLALGAGAARGWAHIGIVKRLEAAGITPKVVVGTSIGAVVGGCHVAGKLDTLEQFARDLTKRRMFSLMDFSPRGFGLINGHKILGLLDEGLINERIENLSIKYGAIATEIRTGHEIWITRGPLVEAMRASYALPAIFPPVKIGARWLFDGALVNPVPVSVCRALGADMVVAVTLNNEMTGRGTVVPDQGADDEDYIATDRLDSRFSALDRAARRKLMGGADAPGRVSAMMEAFNITQERIARARLAGDPPDILITPRLAKIGLFDFHKAGDAITAGWEAADKALADIEAAKLALG